MFFIPDVLYALQVKFLQQSGKVHLDVLKFEMRTKNTQKRTVLSSGSYNLAVTKPPNPDLSDPKSLLKAF